MNASPEYIITTCSSISIPKRSIRPSSWNKDVKLDYWAISRIGHTRSTLYGLALQMIPNKMPSRNGPLLCRMTIVALFENKYLCNYTA